MVEQTARSIAAAPGVRVTLGAQELCAPSLEYVDTHPELRALRFAVPARRRLGSRLRTRVVEQHDRLGSHPRGSLPLRVVNRATNDVNRALDLLTRRVSNRRHARADVYHSPVYALPPQSERARRVRYFLTVYDLIPLLLPELSWTGAGAWLQRILGSVGPEDHVLAISEHTRADLLNTCPEIAPERVWVTPLAADTTRFYPTDDPGRATAVRAKYGIPDGPYVLSVGTLEPRKNIPHLIRTFADLVRTERLDDLQLVLTGSTGWNFEAIFDEAGAQDDVRERVIFTGYVDDADLAPLYGGALVFVYPSFYEGFGLPPLEAMQCGTPVITSNTSSLPEVVGDAGVLVDPRDGAALAQAILDVYRDPARRADLAARARVRARQFTWERYAHQTVDAYRAAL